MSKEFSDLGPDRSRVAEEPVGADLLEPLFGEGSVIPVVVFSFEEFDTGTSCFPRIFLANKTVPEHDWRIRLPRCFR